LGARIGSDGLLPLQTQTDSIAVVRELLDRVPGDDLLVGIATAAVRSARNGRSLIQTLRHELGVSAAILSGEQEALLAYSGAWIRLPTDVEKPVAVVDLGGGSTEIAIGDDGLPHTKLSLPLGLLEFRRPWLDVDPSVQWSELRRVLEARLLAKGGLSSGVGTAVFAAGAARAVWAVGVNLGLVRKNAQLAQPEFRALADELQSIDDPTLLRIGCAKERLDTIRPAACLMALLAELLGAERSVVVEAGIRDGVAALFSSEVGRPARERSMTEWSSPQS
jgi:exopolyphosphatase/guanosine-5'-triphosphate,3'-diphosphate pyrophosphatase